MSDAVKEIRLREDFQTPAINIFVLIHTHRSMLISSDYFWYWNWSIFVILYKSIYMSKWHSGSLTFCRWWWLQVQRCMHNIQYTWCIRYEMSLYHRSTYAQSHNWCRREALRCPWRRVSWARCLWSPPSMCSGWPWWWWCIDDRDGYFGDDDDGDLFAEHVLRLIMMLMHGC